MNNDYTEGIVHVSYSGRKGRLDQGRPIDPFPAGRNYDPLDDVYDPDNLTPEQALEERLAVARSAVLGKIKGRK